MLFLLVTVTFTHTMFVNNSWTELFDSTFDITYFGMALPFLCAARPQGSAWVRMYCMTAVKVSPFKCSPSPFWLVSGR